MMFWYDGCLVEGNALSINTDDPALLYGATAFTTLRVYNRSLADPLTQWDAHCDRVRSSITAFGWQLPNWQRIEQGARALLDEFPVLRITLFPDGRELILGRYLPSDLTDKQNQGVIAWLADTSLLRRSLAQYKTGNYLSAWIALQQAQNQGAKEAILIDNGGNWLETSTGNLWGWCDGCWWTPPVDGAILPGMARSRIFQQLQLQQVAVAECVWSPEFVAGLGAIAYSNSVIEVIPFREIILSQGRLALNPQHSALNQLRNCFLG